MLLDPACGTGGFLTCAVEALKAQASSVEERQSIGVNVRGWEWKPLPYVLAVTNLILHDIELPAITERDALDKPLSNYTRRDQVGIILANPPFGGTVANNNEENFPLNYRTKESADLFLVMMMHLLKTGGRAAIVLPDGSLTGEGVKARIREKWLTDCNLHTIIRLPNSVFSPYATVATNLLFFDKAATNSPSLGGGRGEATKEIWYYEHRLPEGQKSYSKTKPIRREEFQPIEKWWKKRKATDQAWKVDIKTIRERGFDLDIKNPTRATEEETHSSAELLGMLGESFEKSLGLLRELEAEL